jgi:hypothetical protein
MRLVEFDGSNITNDVVTMLTALVASGVNAVPLDTIRSGLASSGVEVSTAQLVDMLGNLPMVGTVDDDSISLIEPGLDAGSEDPISDDPISDDPSMDSTPSATNDGDIVGNLATSRAMTDLRSK